MGNMQEMLESAEGKSDARPQIKGGGRVAVPMITFAIATGEFDANPKCDPTTL